VRRFYRLTECGFGFLVILSVALGQRPVASADKPTAIDAGDPELGQRKESRAEAASVEGLIRLDVTVADQSGNAVAGLQRSDFKLLDNGQPQQIIAFRAAPSSSTNSEDSLSVILLLDTLELPPKLAAFERQQATQFLQQNSGKLAQPVTICTLEDSGFFLTSKPSTDGNALARDIASDTKVKAYFLAPHVSSQLNAEIEPSLSLYPALAGLRALWTIAGGETSRPGRKLLFWIGPSLGISGTGAFDPNGDGLVSSSPDREPFGRSVSGKKGEEEKRILFQKISWFSLLMRQARVTLDCFSLGKEKPEPEIRARFLTPVPSAQEASWMNLFKTVLARQSGGRTLPSSSGLVEPMNDSIENARIFYSLTFNPPLADHGDEYHSLKVVLSQPNLTADTSTGYYDQPFYDDPPSPALQPTTVAQLEQLLHNAHGAAAVDQLSHLVLTERLTQTKLQSLLSDVHDKHLREPLKLLAEQSTFLDLPPAQLSTDPAPSPDEQQRMLKAAADYLERVIPTLPDFFAVRRAVNYHELSAYPGLSTVFESLHAEPPVIENVLYRRGEEVVSGGSTQRPLEETQLQTYGTFGSILRVLQVVSKSPGEVTWDGWEQTASGRRAVFRFRLNAAPTLILSGCCHPNGGSAARTQILSNSHGEFAIDPTSGEILRLQTQSDLAGFVPTDRADVMVSYGPVDIGGKTYVVPLRSVSIWRGRSVVFLLQWNVGFFIWGPYGTQMNVFTFDKYHMSRAKSRILPGFEVVPDKEPTAPQ
jgi:VWFA-related protein